MYELIVLGLIPGTQIQITFGFWLVITLAFFGTLVIRGLHPVRRARNLVIIAAFVAAARGTFRS